MTPSSPAGPGCFLLENPKFPQSGKPREPELIPPLRLGVPSPAANSLITTPGCFLWKWDFIAQHLPQQLHSNDPTTPPKQANILSGLELFFSGFIFNFFFAKKLQRTQFLSRQPPDIFAVFQPALLPRPSPVNPGIIPPSPRN